MTDEKKHSDEPSPFLMFGLEMLKRVDPELKRGIVDKVAETLNVRPGFWAAAGEPPTANAAALLDLGEARYVVAFWDGNAWQAWKNTPGDADLTITQPVNRWAVIPG